MLSLSVIERLLLLEHLPRATGDRSFCRAVLSFRESVAITGEEAKDIGLQASANRVNWDASRETPKDIEAPESVIAFVAASLNEMSKGARLPEQLVRLLDQLDPPEDS